MPLLGTMGRGCRCPQRKGLNAIKTWALERTTWHGLDRMAAPMSLKGRRD